MPETFLFENLSPTSWFIIAPAILILVGYASWQFIKDYRKTKKELESTKDANVQQRITDATTISHKLAEDYKSLWEAEKAAHAICTERIAALQKSVDEMNIRLISRNDELDRLSEKCNLVTEFNLTLQAQIEQIIQDFGLSIQVVKSSTKRN